MYQNGRKTIGVFLSHFFNEFESAACRGISERAVYLNMNVAYFTCFSAYRQESYGLGEMNLLELPDMKHLDGIVFMPGTYAVDGREALILERIKAEADCPVVTANDDLKEFACVKADDQHVLEEIIEHFVVKHKFDRINFISGPADSSVGNDRLECYRRCMRKHGIYDERREFYGDFWHIKAKEAVEYFLSGEIAPPQAIVCANDSMAVTTCIELNKREVRIPEDIAVSGCDNLGITANFIPTLTTVNISNYSIGAELVNKLSRLALGIKGPRVSYASSESVFRESCGCKERNLAEMTVSRHKLFAEMMQNEEEDQRNMFLSVDTQSMRTLDDLYSRLEQYFQSSEMAKEFYLCLSEDWRERKDEEDRFGFTERMRMEFGMRNGERLPEAEFLKAHLLPESVLKDNPMHYFFASLHYRTRCFGYVAISYDEVLVKTKNIQLLLINICNALESYRIREELQQVNKELGDMYIQDVLTGLYNRRGFQIMGQPLFYRAVLEEKKLFVLGADLDGLKIINDTYGHCEGDAAIQIVGKALAAAAQNGEICARVGGDEFSVLGIDYTEEMSGQFVRRFLEKLTELNEQNNQPYAARVSWGAKVVDSVKDHQLEELLNTTDTIMYQMKRDRKEQKCSGKKEDAYKT